jgi:hypothetical protein
MLVSLVSRWRYILLGQADADGGHCTGTSQTPRRPEHASDLGEHLDSSIQ